MKRYLKKLEVSETLIREAIYECLDHNRWKRRDTAYMLADYYNKMIGRDFLLSELSIAIRSLAYKDKTILYPIADYIAKEMYREIKGRDIRLAPIRYQRRKDHSNGKIREIGISSMKQQLYDYVAVKCCQELFSAKIGTYQCASIKGRGQIYGKRAIEKWFRKNPKKCKWIAKCDIRKYYPSVNKDILKRYLKRDIVNEDVLYLLFSLIDTYKDGLCIGSYLSQFLANYLLSYAYHYLDEYCYKIRRGKRKSLIWKKLFYMDDIFMCGPDKRDLRLGVRMLEKYLYEKMNLAIKDGYEIHGLNDYPTDMMGFKMDQKKTTVRKRIFERADKHYRKYKDTRIEIPIKDAKSIVSRYGYFKHSDSKKYLKRMKAARTLDRAKDVIRHEKDTANNRYSSEILVYET